MKNRTTIRLRPQGLRRDSPDASVGAGRNKMKTRSIFEIVIIATVFILFTLFVHGCEGTGPEPVPEPEPTPALDCAEASDCGAGYPDCYTWTCAEGKCTHDEDSSRCGEGYECKPIQGCMPYSIPPEPNCEQNEDCFDGNECTVNECRNGFCSAEVRHDLCFPGQVCDAMWGCVDDGSSLTSQCESDSECDDGIGCTIDLCNMVSHQCNWIMMDSLCANGLVCDLLRGCVSHF